MIYMTLRNSSCFPPRLIRSVFALTAVSVLLMGCGSNNPEELQSPDPKPTPPPAASLPASPRIITVQYADLIEKNALTQAGIPVQKALALEDVDRAQVQPFVDKFSSLLPAVVETELPTDLPPQRDVIERYPVGSPQPAWVAMFRGGRMRVTTDYAGHARVFVDTKDTKTPEQAYKSAYSVVRHCLKRLLPADGSPLEVDVFAFQNDYKTGEISLNLTPYHESRKQFEPADAKQELNCEALERFFQQQGTLEGAGLKDDQALVLYAQKQEKPTIDGQPVSLADLAVAYRAAIHCGDNKAYISLDANPDPTKVNVNFGGFLEDTHIGSVVLRADKRFKTLSSGLDPDTYEDLRSTSRIQIPGFRTSDERNMLDNKKAEKGWKGTRFWFYPEAIEIEADDDAHLMRVSHPFFKADSERSRNDFKDMEEFERSKAAALSPAIRKSIDDMNARYDRFASMFEELRELKQVARLLGVCRWLKEHSNVRVDMDGLLVGHLSCTPT